MIVARLSLLLLSALAGALAAEPPPAKHELIYGAELMTHRERDQYRQRLRGAPDTASQDQARTQQRQRMRERARRRGVELTDPDGRVVKK